MTHWLEIIEVRRSGKSNKQLEAVLFDLCSEIKSDPSQPVIKCFSSVSIEGDYCIHLKHTDKPIDEGSMTGLKIAEILKDHGLVNHARWQERTFNESH